MKIQRIVISALILSILQLSACASTASQDTEIWDPIEPVNRGVFWFNDKFDQFVAEPVASGYDAVTTQGMQNAVRNFFRNLRSPAQVASNIIQLKFTDALKDTGRFVVNTTAGGLGFFDVASDHLDMKYQYQDIGTALGYYDVAEGPYLVLPLLGPSNVRDTFSYATEIFLNPLYWLYGSNAFSTGTDNVIAASAGSLNYINTRARYLDILRDLRRDSVDYYLGQQSYFVQHRRGEIKATKGVDATAEENWFDDDVEE